MRTVEDKLPVGVLSKAVISGQEFGWRKNDFISAVLAAKSVGLAIIGGQTQFVLPDGTCELYWLNYDTAPLMSSESWGDYCERTAKETIQKFQQLTDSRDLIKEGIQNFEFLNAKHSHGVDLSEYLTFVLYFDERKDWMAIWP